MEDEKPKRRKTFYTRDPLFSFSSPALLPRFAFLVKPHPVLWHTTLTPLLTHSLKRPLLALPTPPPLIPQRCAFFISLSLSTFSFSLLSYSADPSWFLDDRFAPFSCSVCSHCLHGYACILSNTKRIYLLPRSLQLSHIFYRQPVNNHNCCTLSESLLHFARPTLSPIEVCMLRTDLCAQHAHSVRYAQARNWWSQGTLEEA